MSDAVARGQYGIDFIMSARLSQSDLLAKHVTAVLHTMGRDIEFVSFLTSNQKSRIKHIT